MSREHEDINDGDRKCRLDIFNLKKEDSIAYPICLIAGELKCTCNTERAQKYVTCHNASDGQVFQWSVCHGFFKIFTCLQQGCNRLTISAPCCLSVCYTVQYRPSTNKRYVRPIYIICSGSDGTFDAPDGEDNSPDMAIQKISLNASLLQTFVAENMSKHSFGRKTFRLERQASGSVHVHIFHSSLDISKARGMTGDELYKFFYDELTHSGLADVNCKMWVFMSCTKYCPPGHDEFDEQCIFDYVKAHTALGGGALALFGTACLHTWASNMDELTHKITDCRNIDKKILFDDSAKRGTYWANYATTLGAAMHELGHCFDLPHTKSGIMARGFDDMHLFFLPHKTDNLNIEEASSPYLDGGAYWHRSSAVSLSLNSWLRETDCFESNIAAPVLCQTSDVLGPVGADPKNYEAFTDSFDTLAWLDSNDLRLGGFLFYYDQYLRGFRVIGYKNKECIGPEATYLSRIVGITKVERCKKCRFVITETDEKIQRLDIRAGEWIDGIQILSNYKSSLWCGGQGGNYYSFHFDEHRQFMGILTMSGEYVGSIGAQVKCTTGQIESVTSAESGMLSFDSKTTYGPIGATDATDRKFPQNFNMQAWLKSNFLGFSGLILYAEKYLSAFQVVGNSSDTSINGQATYLSPIIGSVKGSGVKKTRFLMSEADEKIIKIQVRAGSWIDGIRLFTNYKSSIWCGGTGGNLHTFEFGHGREYIGMIATAGTCIGSLEFEMTESTVEAAETHRPKNNLNFIESSSEIRLLEARNEQGDVYYFKECSGENRIVVDKKHILQGNSSCVLRVLNADGAFTTAYLSC